MAYYLKDLPFTEEGKKLNLSDEDRERFRLVYKKNGESWILHDIWGEGGSYGDDCIVVPLESTYRGCDMWKKGTEFANAIGTTYDTNPAGIDSWISFWKCMYAAVYERTPVNVCCSTNGQILSGKIPGYVIYNKMENCNLWNINSCYTCGGHVVWGKDAKQVFAYMPVYLLPICQSHNAMDNTCYMELGRDTFVVILNYGVYQPDYFAQHPLETHEKI